MARNLAWSDILLFIIINEGWSKFPEFVNNLIIIWSDFRIGPHWKYMQSIFAGLHSKVRSEPKPNPYPNQI